MNKFVNNFLVLILSLTMILSNVQIIGARDSKQNVIPAPYEKIDNTVGVEVFSEDGSLKHEQVDVDTFYQVEDDTEDTDTKVSQISDDEVKSPDDLENASPAPTYNFQYKDLVNNGSDSDNYCILICGDGYTASQQNDFLQTAQNIANYFMSRVPFTDSAVKTKINIRAVCTVSNVSGVNENDANNPYDTFFKSTFWNGGIERLVCIHNQEALDKVIQEYMPECNVPIVVCNSTKYGGSGGSVCTISNHSSATDIAFHEFGHTGGGLADEYWESTTDSSNRNEAPNRTANSNASTCKWSDLIGNNGIGLYPYEEAGVTDWFRPHQNCEMRYLNQEFCEVCKRQIRNVISKVVENKVGENVVISNQDQLLDYTNKVAAGAKTYGKTVTLANDINVTKSFTPMWNFDGTFNGNGHTISGLSYSGGNNTAFIGTLGSNGTVKNLGLSSCTFNSDGWYVGGIVGYNKGTITQSSFDGTVTGNSAVSGIAGWNEGTISDCYNIGTISASQCAGGIVGWMTSGTVNNCYGYGKVTGNYGCGVVGYNPNSCSISNWYYHNGNNSNGGVSYDSSNGYGSTEFSNGTITNKLNGVNNVWKQGSSYPVFSFTGAEVTTTTQNTTKDAFSKIEAENFTSKSNLVVDTNASVSGGHNLGGVINGSYTQYDNVSFSEAASSLTIHYSSPSGTASGNVEVYVDSLSNKVGSIELPNNGSTWSTYSTISGRLSSNIAAGMHTVYLKFVTTNSAYYVANVDYFNFIRANGDTTAPAGFTVAPMGWTTTGSWGCYFGDWAGTASGCYGTSKGLYQLYFFSANATRWLAQSKYEAAVKNGHTYKVTANISTDKNCRIGIKEDISNEADDPVYTSISSGQSANLTGTYTVSSDTIRIIFELGEGVEAGTTLTFNSINIEDLTPETTQTPTTTAKPTTQAPTTVKTTTAATTQAPTTAKPTEASTTTKAQTGEKPATPVGLTYAGNDALPFYFAWQAAADTTYNFYINDQQIATGINGASYNCDSKYFTSAGNYTIAITAVKNGVESDKAAITYNVTTGNVGTTVTPTTTQALVEGRELLNNTVFNDSTEWNEYGGEFTNNGDGTVSVKVPAATGGDNWSTQLVDNGIVLTEGRWYKATVTITSDVARKFQLLVQSDGQDGGNWNVINTDNVFSVEAGVPYTYQTVFQANGIQNNYLYGIMMGYVDKTESKASNVTISNVSLKEYGSEPETEKITTARPTEAPTTEKITEAPTTQEPTSEKPTEAPTTEKITEEQTTKVQEVSAESVIKVEGYQISTTYEGFRVIGSVEPTINGKNVSKWGFVYGLSNVEGKDTGISNEDMVVGSNNYYIASFESTSAGTISAKAGESSTATYYVRTMKFVSNTNRALTAKYCVRAYALMEDGTYLYGTVKSFTVFDIADILYKNNYMASQNAHDYLYDNILSIVRKDYGRIDFNWNNTVANMCR